MKKNVKEGEFLDSLISSIVANIQTDENMSIVDFAHEIVFNGDPLFQLFPTQQAMLKAFYNEPLSENDKNILKQWSDDKSTTWVEGRRYNNLVLEAGRRASKSTLASIAVLYEFYNLITLDSPAKKYGLLPSSPIAIIVVGQSADQVKETIFAAIRGYAENSYFFKGLADNGMIEILATEIKCSSKNVAIYAKSTNLKSLVGFSIKVLVLDEASRFETSQETGVNIALEVWRNTGKGCQVNNTFIPTTKGSISLEYLLQCSRNAIGNFMPQSEQISLPTTTGTRTTLDVLRNSKKNVEKQDIGIITYDLEGRRKVIYDYKIWFNGVEPTLELTTRSGRKEICTHEHPFLVWYENEDNPRWVALENLKEGDTIAIAKSHDLFGSCNIGINKARLIGYLVGDGGVSAAGIGFTNTDSVILKDLQNILDLEFPGSKLVNSDAKRGFQYRINRGDSGLRTWLDNIGMLHKSINKVIPDVIKQGSKEEIAAFINGIFSTDGTIPNFGDSNKNNLEISVTLNNKLLIEELQKELIKFGIFSRIRTRRETYVYKNVSKEFEASHLAITDKHSIIKYYEEIGVTGEKEKRLEETVEKAKQRSDSLGKTEFNYMPVGAVKRLLKRRKEKKILWKDFTKGDGAVSENNRMTIKRMNELAKLVKDEELIKWCNSDIRWEKVKSLKDFGEQPTIGIEVPESHIIGNDIISHNTAAFGKDGKKIAISSAWEKGDPIEQLRELADKDFQSLAFQLTTFQINLNMKKGITPVIVSDYTQDPVAARLEYENIRYSKHNTFLPKENLEKALTGVTCVDAQPIDIDVKTVDEVRHYVGCEILRLANADINLTSFIHVDPALKKDSAALAIASPYQFEDAKWGVQIDGLLKWEPHVDSNGCKRLVSFIDIEEKLKVLAEARNVKMISFDQWNSAALIQKLHLEGVTTKEMSTSRDMQIIYYTLFRDLLSHGLVVLPKDSLWSSQAVVEMSELVMKPNKQIVHPVAGKDLADAIVNATFNCFQFMTDTGLCTGLSSGISKVGSAIAGTLLANSSKHQNKKLIVGNAIKKLNSFRK